jgi:hypothetical protein
MNSFYVKTKLMAQILGYSSDFLLNNREIIFFEGEHYFTQNKRINWKVSAMTDWIENRTVSNQAQEILKMVS